ncbi:hypothetical protein GR183_13625 [Stappia sp. GBMRC 2046]|uniref:Solute:sodium symporter small subunit n=1 Tax=Stappia sediminis TaxID=2692190 RepID=A0A7X3LVQ1_9HYPH|nr:hypothetical protein [Stappia sediminis]MXN65948.1 hypothetical protein [Stappia sediminis]
MNAYKKEWTSTLVFGALYVVLAHTGLFAIAFGVDNDTRVLGFPLHYFIAIVLGSAGILAVSIVWNRYADQLESEIEAENNKTAPEAASATGALAAANGFAREGAQS